LSAVFFPTRVVMNIPFRSVVLKIAEFRVPLNMVCLLSLLFHFLYQICDSPPVHFSFGRVPQRRKKQCIIYSTGRFVKQEQWERWRAKRKLVSGFKHRGAGSGDMTPGKIWEIVC